MHFVTKDSRSQEVGRWQRLTTQVGLNWRAFGSKFLVAIVGFSYDTTMSEIHYITGDATAPVADGNKLIVHVCNDIGAWGKGFVMALSKRWKDPEGYYRQWFNEGDKVPFELGQVQFVSVEKDLWVANLIGQRGIRRSAGKPPVRYNAIEAGLKTVAEFALENKASVHMPRIGCGLAGGSWDEIEPLLNDTLVSQGISVTVYDFG